MSPGDRRVFLFDRIWKYQIPLPAPHSEENVLNHLAQLTPTQRRGIDIVEMQVVSVRSADMDTIPAPPPVYEEALLTDAEFDELLGAGCWVRE